MPHSHRDEISKLDDIESLLTTARDLALRFKGPELREATRCLHTSLEEVEAARQAMIDNRRKGSS